MFKHLIVCAGLDNVLRGYETHTRLLFTALRKENINIALIKRTGVSNVNEVSLNTPFRYSTLVKILSKTRGNNLYWESLIFALALILRVNLKVKTILVIEPVVAKVLYKYFVYVRRYQRLFSLKIETPRLVYTHGVSREPNIYNQFCDFIHEVSEINYSRLMMLNDKKPSILIPHFLPSEINLLGGLKIVEKSNLKILYVGAWCNTTKNVMFMVEEIYRSKHKWELSVLGKISDHESYNKSKLVLGDRISNSIVENSKIGAIMAQHDLLVMPSLNEGFGIVILEAMKYRIPVVCHNNSHFRWVLNPNKDCFVNMTKEGALRYFLDHVYDDSWRSNQIKMNWITFNKRYTWNAVRKKYLSLLKDEV